MTQNELAQKLNVTDKAVSRWERGIGTPDISLLTRLSAILDTDIEAVLEGNFTSEDPGCKGLLIMKYPHNIAASSFLYTKRIVYFQLGFFLLAGIREICIRGRQEDVCFTESALGNGGQLGINLVYETAEDESALNNQSSEYFCSCNKISSFFVINGLFFLYGKDITSSLNRIILDSDLCTTLVDYQKRPLPLCFYPSVERLSLFSKDSQTVQNYPLLRGIISFPIKNEKDLFDAGNIVRIIEEQQVETVADLHEIARNRGYIS